MRGAAILTLVFFGCAIARPPAAPSMPHAGPAPARVALAEPELELWLEGTRRPEAAESQRALDRGRAALAAALADRGMEDVDDPDALLVVRSRAVSRTSERRNLQVFSAVAIVTVVAAVVAILVLSRHDPKPQRARALPAASRGVSGPVRAFRPHPRRAPPASFFWGWSVGVHVGIPVTPVPPPPPGMERVREPDPLLDARGWFDADEVELTLELVDPASGDVRWRRALREPVDPLDAAAMGRLVDRALADEPFGRRGATSPPRRERPASAPEPSPPPGPPPGPEGVDL